MDADQELLAIFRVEVDEQIEDLTGLLERPPSKWRVDRLFQISHNVKGAARLVGAEAVQGAAHALEDLFSAVRGGLELDAGVAALARSGAELVAASFTALEGGGEPPDVAAFRARVDALVGDRGARPAPASSRAPAPEPAEATTADGAAGAGADDRGASRVDTVRVATAKIDALMGVSSELVSQVLRAEGHHSAAHAAALELAGLLRRTPALRADPAAARVLRELRELERQLRDHATDSLRLSDEVQASVRALRLVRVDGIATLASRTVRAAAGESGRAVAFRLVGGHTEIDRAILEQLRDPLVHLLRNAVAHGIEAADERRAAGKPEEGTVELEARSAGAWVELTVRDDGRGIDPERIRRRALASAELHDEGVASMGREDLLELLFRPGFSTVDDVTELAGRGVGLDVVRSRLADLGGGASLDSQPDRGTEVRLRVPLTRLTTTGLVVRVGRQLFALPGADVERAVQIRRDELAVADGSPAVSLGGRLVRVASLAAMLGRVGDESPVKPAVVVSDGSRRRALLVDEVLGQQEYIVQPLPWNLRGLAGVAGVTVLKGSTVVLVLDGRSLAGLHGSVGEWQSQREVRQYRIVVADDSATSRTLVRNILRTAGYGVTTANDGEEALELVRREPPDLVVSDVEMPRLDGLELTRRIRRDPDLGRLPVILVTSLGSEEHQRLGAEAGADAYIVKGAFDQDELLRSVARLL